MAQGYEVLPSLPPAIYLLSFLKELEAFEYSVVPDIWFEIHFDIEARRGGSLGFRNE